MFNATIRIIGDKQSKLLENYYLLERSNDSRTDIGVLIDTSNLWGDSAG